MADKKKGLELLREPFSENQISKLPKGTKAQNECKAEEKINCKVCGGWHHPRIIHLDYVGHAALTDRLLDVDPNWNWEPMALDTSGYPMVDKDGGMWIKLTICGLTRLGYGDAQGKTGANATKERIGDALRNAAMRFGAALDLWHKGDLHVEDEGGNVPRLAAEPMRDSTPPSLAKDEIPEFSTLLSFDELREKILATTALPHLKNVWVKYKADVAMLSADESKRLTTVKDAKKIELQGGDK